MKDSKTININGIYSHLQGDKIIWFIVILLGVFSILAVYSAAGHMAFTYQGGNTEYYLLQQFVFIGIGFFVMYICYSINYMQYAKLAPILILLTLPLLIYTLFFGPELNEARRWIEIPWINRTIQTSDIAKLSLIIFIAKSLSMRQDYIKDFKNAFLPVIIPITVVCFLIIPADLSTGALLFITCLLMMFIGRVSFKYILLLILTGAIGMLVIFMLGEVFDQFIRTETWLSRLAIFLNENGDDQIVQSKIAIANGGWFGVGPGNSIQRHHLYAAYADFIYSVICEEYGVIGGLVILGLYLWLLMRCISIVTKCPKAFGAILALGLCLNLVIQAFANIAVSVQLLPTTGLTLPLVSMGGTSIIFTCMSLGIILSVSRFVDQAQESKMELAEIENRDANNM